VKWLSLSVLGVLIGLGGLWSFDRSGLVPAAGIFVGGTLVIVGIWQAARRRRTY
jgi:hypothetical protein